MLTVSWSVAAITHSAPSPAAVAKRERARSVAEQGFDGAAGRVLAEAVQFLLVGIEDYDPALAGELPRQLAPGLAGPDDDDPGEVVRRRRAALRSGVREAFRHGGVEPGAGTDSRPVTGGPGQETGGRNPVQPQANS